MSEENDKPITLERACAEIFDDEITPHVLKAEAENGNITIAKFGRKWFTTVGEARALFARKAQGSIGIRKEKRGASATALSESAQVAALRSALMRKPN
ncbi:MAG TPA: hypothetical protein VKT73_12770 [Xanthobacteraceae bacterium]|nr:hypothetical protein [Xanthobacteraceae bacterium]